MHQKDRPFDWDDAFANSARVKGSAEIIEGWKKRGADYRARLQTSKQDVPYGSHERERYDLFLPDEEPIGLAFYIHGGYWMRLDKSYWSQFAEGARSRGWAVCIPSYTLTPETRISGITHQIANVINMVAGLVSGPIRLAGHSAGGHLAARMICQDSRLESGVLERIEHVLSISGVHDLRPLMMTEMNETLRLDEAEASSESPVLQRPLAGKSLTCWVGGNERPEFIRQSRLLQLIWSGLGADVDAVYDAHRDHFTVLEALSDPQSKITKRFVG